MTYRLGNVVDDNGTVGVAIVHGSERFVSLLTSCVPDLEFDRRVFVEGNCLREKGGTDGGFSVGVELILGEGAAGLSYNSARPWGEGQRLKTHFDKP